MITSDDIIYSTVKNTNKDFDSVNGKLLQEVESEICTFYSKLISELLKGADFTTNKKMYFLSLLIKAEDILISSLCLTRQRAYIETFVLLRVAIEAVSTAIHINNVWSRNR